MSETLIKKKVTKKPKVPSLRDLQNKNYAVRNIRKVPVHLEAGQILPGALGKATYNEILTLKGYIEVVDD